jgi:hypothetical protein
MVILASLLGSVPAAPQQQPPAEQAVWKLEHSYWEYVKALDLKNYRTLWHPNFVGWPSVSNRPQRKDHITGWIKLETDKGLRLKAYVFNPAASQSTGNIVVDHYWLTMIWTGNNGKQPPSTIRITHTWVRVGNTWKIIGGMSSPEAHPPR